jgi:hypothetical protein
MATRYDVCNGTAQLKVVSITPNSWILFDVLEVDNVSLSLLAVADVSTTILIFKWII